MLHHTIFCQYNCCCFVIADQLAPYFSARDIYDEKFYYYDLSKEENVTGQ